MRGSARVPPRNRSASPAETPAARSIAMAPSASVPGNAQTGRGKNPQSVNTSSMGGAMTIGSRVSFPHRPTCASGAGSRGRPSAGASGLRRKAATASQGATRMTSREMNHGLGMARYVTPLLADPALSASEAAPPSPRKVPMGLLIFISPRYCARRRMLRNLIENYGGSCRPPPRTAILSEMNLLSIRGIRDINR